MAPRLLTLLKLIEVALSNNEAQAVSTPPSRSVNFHKGLARMTFTDGSGSILLQNFTLADGEICVRATLVWEGRTTEGSHAIYPRENFDWFTAADQIANVWLAGLTGAASTTQELGEAESSNRDEPISATG